jgi:tRNA nucleotidyltransferase (CCA-adding enzyme)
MIEKYNEIFNEVLGKIKPEKRYVDTFLSEVNRIISWFNTAIRSENVVAECTLGGSVAKGSFLKNDHDVDLFVKFSKEYNSKELATFLEHLILLVSKKLNFKYKKVHGSRDYFQFEYREIKFEVVPVLKIFNVAEAENITDASPLHVGFIKKQISKKPKLADQIRLTKQFCKSVGVYGAESYIKGLSGHSLDLLTCFYGSFINFASSTKYWNDKVIIDVEGKLKEPLKDLNPAKTKSPIILVDPVDNSRNATAALSKEKFELLKVKAQEFINNPSIEFFKVKKLDLKEVKNDYKKEWGIFFSIEPITNNSQDIQGTAILKAQEFIARNLKSNDFKIIKKGFDFDHMYFIIKKEVLSDYVLHRGPPKRQRNDCKEFVAKYKGRKKVFDKDHRLYVRIKRKFNEPLSLVKKLITDEYVTSRVKKTKLLARVR